MSEERCLPCEAEIKKKRNLAHIEQRAKIIERLSKQYANEKIITVAIVETKNGFLSDRKLTDESLSRLRVVEYISFLSGTPVEQVH